MIRSLWDRTKEAFIEILDSLIIFLIFAVFVYKCLAPFSNGDDLTSCSIFFIFPPYFIIIIYLTVKTVNTVHTECCIKRKAGVLLEPVPNKSPGEVLSDLILKLVRPAFRGLTLFSVLYTCLLKSIFPASYFFSTFLALAVSIYLGQLTFLLAVVMLSIWIIRTKAKRIPSESEIDTTILIHLLMQFTWTFFSVFILNITISALKSDFLLFDLEKWFFPLALQISAFYFQIVYFYYYKRLTEITQLIP